MIKYTVIFKPHLVEPLVWCTLEPASRGAVFGSAVSAVVLVLYVILDVIVSAHPLVSSSSEQSPSQPSVKTWSSILDCCSRACSALSFNKSTYLLQSYSFSTTSNCCAHTPSHEQHLPSACSYASSGQSYIHSTIVH